MPSDISSAGGEPHNKNQALSLIEPRARPCPLQSGALEPHPKHICRDSLHVFTLHGHHHEGRDEKGMISEPLKLGWDMTLLLTRYAAHHILGTSAGEPPPVWMWDQTASLSLSLSLPFCKVLPLCQRISRRRLCTHETHRPDLHCVSLSRSYRPRQIHGKCSRILLAIPYVIVVQSI